MTVKTSWTPAPLRALQRLDDALYAVSAPHLLDLLAVGALAVLAGTGLLAGWRFAGRRFDARRRR